MEVTGLVLGTAQAVVQLAGVVKRHVVSYASLQSLASSVDAKAKRTWDVSQKLEQFAESSGMSKELLNHALDDLKVIQDNLSTLDTSIEGWKSAGMFFQAPVVRDSLKEIDDKLTQVEFFFRIVGIQGSMNLSQRSEMRVSIQELRELILEACSCILSLSEGKEEAQKHLLRLQSQLQHCQHPEIPVTSSTGNAEIIFNLGLAEYGLQPGSEKPFGHRGEPQKIQSAARCFHRACILGKKEAFRYLGDIYYQGEGVDVCYRTAMNLFQQGATRNDPGSKYKLGWCHGFGHGTDVDAEKCVRLLEESAEEEYGEAMFQLGAFKLFGKMVPCSYGQAYRLVRKAEQKNTFQAKGVLATCYQFGVGVERDPVKAFSLFQESFDAGNYFATVPLAECYDKGIGVKQDSEMASRVYEKCMASGTWYGDFYKAYHGLRLVKGKDVEQNIALGKALIIDSTKSGSALSWQALGECYRYGLGVNQDFRQAKKFFFRAVRLKNGVFGIARSYLALGEMFETGQGVLPNTRRANKYYLSAAERLNQTAQWKVANAFEIGVGQRMDVHRAAYFYKLCANSGHIYAQRKTASYYMKGHGLERPRLYVRRMIEEEARKGNREAKRWVRRERDRSLGVLFRRWSITGMFHRDST